MGRRNASGLELTWHPSGRWVKRGKDLPGGCKYFGYGKSRDDRASYDAALAAYRAWQKESQQTVREAETWQRVESVLRAVNGGSTPPFELHDPASPTGTVSDRDLRRAIRAKRDAMNRPPTVDPAAVAETLQGTKAGDFVVNYLKARAEEEARRHLVRQVTSKPLADLQSAATATASTQTPPQRTTGDLLDLYDAWNERRNHQRKRNDRLREEGREVREKKSQAISDERLGTIRRILDRWKASHGRRPWDGSERTLTAYLNDWKADADRRGMASHDSAMAVAAQFVQWAYDQHHLDQLPRNLKRIVQKYDAKNATAVAIPADDLLTLFEGATDDMRAWIALGLNCGFYAKDISDLEGRDVGPTHLDFWREKTINTAKVNVRYKLWGVTRELIARSRTTRGDGERVWTTRKGHPLVHHADTRTRGKSNNVAKQFRDSCRAVGLVDAVPDPTKPGQSTMAARYDFTNLRDTGSTAMDRIDKALTDVYLAHADPRQARLYVDKRMVDTKPLDAALDQLEQTFALPLPPPRLNKWKGRKGGSPAAAAP